MNIIETMSVREAAEKLRAAGMKISAETIRLGLKDRRFPFGDYIPNGKNVGTDLYLRCLQPFA